MNTEQSSGYDDDEISLVDIIRFFQRRWRLIGVMTLVVAIAGTATTAFQAPTYQRTLTLAVEPDPLDRLLTQLNPTDGTTNRQMTPLSEIGQWAESAAGTVTQDAVSVSAAPYDATNNMIALTLTAPTAPPLEGQVEPIMKDLAIAWQQPLQERIADELRLLTIQANQVEQTMAMLDEAIAATPSDNLARRTALETQRAEVLRADAAVTFQQDYFQTLQTDLERKSTEFLPLTVMQESGIDAVQRSPIQVATLGLIAGFMVATLIAIILEQWPHLQAELASSSPTKPDAKSARPE